MISEEISFLTIRFSVCHLVQNSYLNFSREQLHSQELVKKFNSTTKCNVEYR
ncbi:hypothetical protein BC833DRAFT_582947 [Globomyces pollinis-pini]|nr:hypothetical protein BC833DRAFT_582947 [Globomyces pollinis-pini]